MTTLKKYKQDVEDVWRVCDGDLKEFKRQMAVCLCVLGLAYIVEKRKNEIRP